LIPATDSQLCAITALRSEIEGIDRTIRESGASASSQPENALSYSFGLSSDVSSFLSADQTAADIVASVRDTLAKLAPVYTLETSRDGLTVRSVIQYSGRVVSVWGQDKPSSFAATAELAAAGLAFAHMASLERTYALRIAFARAIAAAGSTLVAVSVAVANPLTALHALASATALKQALDRLSAAVTTSG
jgi:hypothetical protein